VLHVAYRNASNVLTIFKRNIGTIDLASGLITIANFTPLAIENDEIDVRIRVIPAVNDFTPHLNRLFTIDAATSWCSCSTTARRRWMTNSPSSAAVFLP
jgi:hypothetical protein